MKHFGKAVRLALPASLAAAGIFCCSAAAQVPAPIIVDTAAPIIVKAIKPRPKANGQVKFEGYVLNANIAQITARGKANDMAVQTFSLSQEASAKMQQVVDKGGYQYGDKVTIFYDPATMKASKFKGKPSKPI